jgi:hypothetical protein
MLNAITYTLMWVNVNFDYSWLLRNTQFKIYLFWMYSWVWLLNVHLVGLALPELKIKQADCPVDERTYW